MRVPSKKRQFLFAGAVFALMLAFWLIDRGVDHPIRLQHSDTGALSLYIEPLAIGVGHFSNPSGQQAGESHAVESSERVHRVPFLGGWSSCELRSVDASEPMWYQFYFVKTTPLFAIACLIVLVHGLSWCAAKLRPRIHARRVRRDQYRQLDRGEHCPVCGYDLHMTESRCPECGGTFLRKTVIVAT